jgi:hypothetical protein
MMKFAVGFLVLGFSVSSLAITPFTVYKCQSKNTGIQLEAIPEFGEIAVANAQGETLQQIDSTTAKVDALSAPGAKKISFVHEEGDTVLVVIENGSEITATFNGDSSFVCTK